MRLFPSGIIRGRPGALALCAFLLAAALSGAVSGQTPPENTNYNGHYEMVDVKAGRKFSLDVKQAGSRAEVSFAAVMTDGSGAAPDGTGKGRVEDGVLSFAFKDNFSNEGTCTLELLKDGYHLSMTVLKVADPAPFHFYGTFLLRKTPDKGH